MQSNNTTSPQSPTNAEMCDCVPGGYGDTSEITNFLLRSKKSARYPNNTYEVLLYEVATVGSARPDRTGTGTRALFGRQLRYDLQKGFPLITTKKVHWKSIVVELLWMLRGDSNIAYLHEHGVTIWDEWANENGDLGAIYGVQWRNFNEDTYQRISAAQDCCVEAHSASVDQIANVVKSLKNDPYGRRHIVSAWNPSQIKYMALPPCHMIFQFYVADGKLSCHINQRSADMFLGVPFNIASYALLTHIIAAKTGYDVGELVWTGGDCHVYDNHIEQVEEQTSRTAFTFPDLDMDKYQVAIRDFSELTPEMFKIRGYEHHPAIKGVVAV